MNEAGIAAVLRQLDPALWVVTARDGERRGGLVATFVSIASIVPEMPRMLVALGKSHRTWELVERSGSMALHLIGEARLDWIWRFGLESGRSTTDKFAGLHVREGITGAPILDDALGWLEGQVEARMDIGDRTVFLVEIVDGGMAREEPILTVRRMLEMASEPHRQILDAHLIRDQRLDEEAIAAWRSRAGRDSPGRIMP